MEDNLKIWKIEYLSSKWSDFPQILNTSSWDQAIVKKGFNEDNIQMKMTFKWRRPLMEADLKIWEIEYLSNHWSDLPQILNISSWDQIEFTKGLNEDDLQWKMTYNGRWPKIKKK